MRIKTFSAATLKEATDLMKNELGPEAIILNTRKVAKGGLLNFVSKETFEITAALDEQMVTKKGADKFAKHLALADSAVATAPVSDTDTLSNLQKMTERFEHRVKQKGSDKQRQVDETLLTETAEYVNLRNEMQTLRSLVQEVAVHLKYTRMPSLPEHLKTAYATLLEHEVTEQLAADLTQAVYRRLGEDLLTEKSAVDECLLGTIASIFKPLPKERVDSTPKIVALVGPTGVGKTTTIAKLAATEKLINNMDVALITADTYRIGAIDQLRTFATIADIPMEIVYKPSEMKTAIAKFKDKDVIFIDTVGRSQRVKKDISELSKFVSAANPAEVHLVLSAAASMRTLLEIVDKFRAIAPNRIIFSKLDEAVAFGQMLNIAHISGLPVSFIATGQSVPEDIKMANNVQLSEMIYTGELTHA